MPFELLILALVIILGLTHALEPDHVVAMRMMKGVKDYLLFGFSHGLGFALIAIPLILIFTYFQFYGILAGDIIAVAFAIVLIYAEITEKEIEVSPRGSGLIQGAFALTPSKVIVAVLAAEGPLLIGLLYVGTFILVSSIAMLLVGLMLDYVPKRIEKGVNIGIAVVTISYVVYTILTGQL